MTGSLTNWARSRGLHVGWAPAGVLGVVRAELEARRMSGELDPAFARDNLAFDFGGDQAVAGCRVLVVVMPRPAHVVAFDVGGRRIEAVLPPTYQRYRSTFEDVRRELAEHVLCGAKVETLDAPLKPLAARLGLVRYGRNNVAYAPSIGSYLQLLGYITDASLPIEPDWTPHQPALLDECADCGVCEALCPTSAISRDRVLLHAQRCVTLASETAGSWPSWVPAGVHNCLIGCLECQRLCPANPEMPVSDSGVVFDEEQTRALLAEGEPTGPAWVGIRRNLQTLGQWHHESVVGRNLKSLLEARALG